MLSQPTEEEPTFIEEGNTTTAPQVSLTLDDVIRIEKEKKKRLSEINKLIKSHTSNLSKTLKESSVLSNKELSETRERVKSLNQQIDKIESEIKQKLAEAESKLEENKLEREKKNLIKSKLRSFEVDYDTALVNKQNLEEEKGAIDNERASLKEIIIAKKSSLPYSTVAAYNKAMSEVEAKLESKETPESELKQLKTKFNKLRDAKRLYDEYENILVKQHDVHKRYQIVVNNFQKAEKEISEKKKALKRAKQQYEPMLVEASESVTGSDELKKFITKARKQIAQLKKERKELLELIDTKSREAVVTGSDIKNEITELTLKRLQIQEEVDSLSKFVHTEKMNIDPEMIGKVFGKKGATIKSIREKSGSDVNINKELSQVVIKGTPETVAVAKELIEKLFTTKKKTESTSIRFKMEMFVPLTRVVSQWKKETGADIFVDKLEGSCKITGSTEQIKAARKLINEFLEKGLQEKTIQITKLGQSHEDMIDLLFGLKGENLKKIQNLDGVVNTVIDKKANVVKISGTGSGADVAIKHVAQLMKDASIAEIPLQKPAHGEVIIEASQKIQKETNTRVTVVKKSNTIKITGYKQDEVQKAKSQVEAIISKELEHERKTQHKQVLRVDVKVARNINKQRSKIQTETDTIVKVNLKDSSITVFGETEEKVKAVVEIIEKEKQIVEQRAKEKQEKAQKESKETTTTQTEQTTETETKETVEQTEQSTNEEPTSQPEEQVTEVPPQEQSTIVEEKTESTETTESSQESTTP
ncbi:predicted protein [Naegleria gruberi]|uniref:Predicted protein n=1 Tax=Naegleria gruberi TaxID=5762 RepID=D2VEC9_NAEGR|nr:uncharacterized protein NAEGRDRAFT_67234 [Naegleria gruberi]EFC44857.1 predicted protein [Naegleria gruberi]|eukprot:XP_002677601.1 predicted protein [Naegleria gruberi strain NEG-M]